MARSEMLRSKAGYLMQDRHRQLDEILLRRTAGPYIGSIASFLACSGDVCLSPDSNRLADVPGRPKGANSCREKPQQVVSLFDHFVGQSNQLIRHGAA